MPSVLEQLLSELGSIQNKALPSGSPVGPYLHGPGGLFGVEGLERPVISTRVAGSGIASALPSRGTNITNPLYPYISGFLASTGSNANGVCDDPMTAGPIKNCFQTADFGRYSFQSREVELNRIGQRVNRGEFLDLELVNPLLSPQGGGILSPDSANNSGRDLLNQEMRMRMVEIGVAFENSLARQIYVGNPANNSAGGGYQEFPGLDILIGTTKVDAKTGTPCPSLRSDIKAFNYQNVTTSGGGTIVNVLTYMMRMLKWNADRMNMGGTTWAIVMRPTLFMELTAVWPCAYMTYRCLAQDNTQTQLVIDSNDQLAMRDAMRNGNYLLIDGIQYPVILDTGIVEENHADNGAIGITSFASDIYVVPLTIRNGTMAATYWEYFDYSGDNAAMASASLAGWDSFFWTDGGRYLWHRKPPLNWCVQMLAKIEPRIILLTPHLAGRVTDVQYTPLQHERDAIIGDDYFVDGGDTNRRPGRLYSDWSASSPT
jgi:hypothetical protein